MALGALPLSVALMFVALAANIPRYFIAQYQGERELGIFSAVAYLMVIGSQLVQAMGQSAIPRLARLFAAGDRRGFSELLWKLTGIAVALGLAGVGVVVVAGSRMLTVLYSGEYAQARGEFLLLMIAAGGAYVSSVLGYGITATRKFGRFVLPYAGLALATLVASALLIPGGGLRGAAWATVISNAAGIVAALVVLVSVKESPDESSAQRAGQQLC
jgi:O-antigen/teichoic acid export membrane protein